LIDWLERQVGAIVSHEKLRMDRLLGVGISLPGIVRGREGVSESYMNFDGKPVRDILHERFEKPVHVEHDESRARERRSAPPERQPPLP
jgi:predicted NBD/HSP70 family sugar kinase